MNPASTSFVLGYHGCDRSLAEHVLRGKHSLEPFDTVRALFMEGERLYENAGFAAKNHIQICVRTAACIKGYFRPLDDHGRPLSFA